MLVLRRYGLLFAGVLLLLVGGIVLVAGAARFTEVASFGWTAYAPIESTTFFVPYPMSQIVTGVILMVLGLIAAAIWFVLWLNRSRAAE